MPFQFNRLSRLLCVTFLLLGFALPGQAAPARLSVRPVRREPLVVLPTDLSRSRILRRAVPVGRIESTQTISAALSLPWRNGVALQDLIKRQNDPLSPMYKKWLSAAEFDARFAPSAKDYATVIGWAKNNGLAVAKTFPSRNLMIVRGSAAAAAAAFHVDFGRYRLPDGRVAYASTATPRLPRSVALIISSVSGLDNLSMRHPMLRRRALRPAPYFLSARQPHVTVGGSGAAGSLTPADIKSVYNLTATDLPDGTGQTLALYELDGYVTTDIQTYATAFGLGTPALQNILLNDFSGIPTTGADSSQTEVTLDLEMAIALAPAANILVYEADNSSAGSLAIYTQIADDDLASVVSVSYGLAEEDLSDSERSSEYALFQKMVAQGQCVYVSSGDEGSYNATARDTDGSFIYTVSVSDPASQPDVVAVGGTKLSATVPTATTAVPDPVAQYVGETTWNTFTTTPTDVSVVLLLEGATGGGISKYWPKPDYQTGVGASLNRPGSPGGTISPMRDVPDVALNADPDPGYTIYQANVADPIPFNDVATGYTVVGGTSAAAPLWAAFNILVNQKRAASGLAQLGFANTDIYSIAESSNYLATFQDITTGTNVTYSATTGYDDTTGWGSFNGAALLAKLAPSVSSPQTLTVAVTDASGTPISGASVVISTPQIPSFTNADTTGAYPVTDASGNYTVALNSLFQNTAGTIVALTYAVTVDKSGFAGKSFSSVGVPATLAVTLNTPDHVFSNPTVLQMISAPYDYTTVGNFLALFDLTSADLVQSVADPHPPNLIAYSPLLSRYLVYPNAPADTLRLGQGYWARLPADGTVHRNGTPAPTNQAFRINLQAGWNQIGNPFLMPVSVSSLSIDSTTASGSPISISLSQDVALPLYGYTLPTSTTGGSYQALNVQTDSLQPWTGYWIFAKDAVTLIVPPPGG